MADNVDLTRPGELRSTSVKEPAMAAGDRNESLIKIAGASSLSIRGGR